MSRRASRLRRLREYPGADASFKVYEDEGDTYNYERGFYSTYELRWDDKHSTLTISGRKGKYAGMPVTRKLKIVKVSKALGVGTGETDKGILVEYKGNRVDVEL